MLSGATLASCQNKKACKGKKAVVIGSEDKGTINSEMAPRGKYNILDKMLCVQKDTRVKTKKRVPIPPDAEEMLEICLHCASDVCFSPFYLYAMLILKA
jgi:hypothetical protein